MDSSQEKAGATTHLKENDSAIECAAAPRDDVRVLVLAQNPAKDPGAFEFPCRLAYVYEASGIVRIMNFGYTVMPSLLRTDASLGRRPQTARPSPHPAGLEWPL